LRSTHREREFREKSECVLAFALLGATSNSAHSNSYFIHPFLNVGGDREFLKGSFERYQIMFPESDAALPFSVEAAFKASQSSIFKASVTRRSVSIVGRRSPFSIRDIMARLNPDRTATSLIERR
ncbi:MAG TPA: hypothetical protein PLS03_17295, partial [Terrimicrobiaceae bacterium]|nr:hypothetical protein [Terrimicrobiaceae bacterium]